MHLYTQPYLLSLHPATEMCVVWLQAAPAAGKVCFGTTPALEEQAEAVCYEITGLHGPASPEGYKPTREENPAVTVWQCVATLTGLTPGQRVYYRCEVDGQTTPVYHFRTAPLPGGNFRFAQLSDLQGMGHSDETVRLVGQQAFDFALYSGDAVYHSWRADDWFHFSTEGTKAFFPCLQQEGAAITPYRPLFFCPGNHEVDDLRVGTDKYYTQRDENWTWSVFMQIFRPLYPDTDTGLTGRRWYSVDYGDMHIVSLSIQRWAVWLANEAPGWRLADSIAKNSPQLRWLEQDLAAADAKFKWVIQHWHLLNKGYDVQYNLCQPVEDAAGGMTYPDDDGGHLMEVFEKYGVNAVSYGHSHVYERYFTGGCHYIEAAYFGICFREEGAPLHPTGMRPVLEDLSQRSFLLVERREGGLFATGYYAQEPPVAFDRYCIADENGQSVWP